MPYIGASPDKGNFSDLNGAKLILDADADTHITADTDDQIDIQIAGADDFQFTANTFTVLSGSTLTIASGATISNSGTATGFGGSKNMLINGSMAVAQRGTQTGQGGSEAYSACDRWVANARGSPQGRVTTTQTSDTNMNLNGHEYTLKFDCTTAESAVGAAEACLIQQKIEAQNLQGLKYGTANAEEVTLSFWFSSPKTGIHCASIYLSDTGYSQIKEFTIASANTWEYFAITFSANTSNKINNDTGSGLIVSFALTAGSNFQVSANAWASGEDFATSNQQNLLDSTSNNVSLAGVQLEIGSVATSFSHEDYSTTLARCQRYYRRWYGIGGSMSIQGHGNLTSRVYGGFGWSQPMRAKPTMSTDVGGNATVTARNATIPTNTTTFTGSALNWCSWFANLDSPYMTAGEGCALYFPVDYYFDASAEL